MDHKICATWTWLSRVDPDEHMNRWYAVGVQPGLFDQVAVIRLWGSRERDYQQVMVQAFDEFESARTAADALIREKVRRGYRVVGGYAPPGIERSDPEGR